MLSFFNLKNTKLIRIIKFLVSVFVSISFINVIVDSNKTDIEVDAGQYLKNSGFENKLSVKLINAERVGYYGGMSIPDLIKATNPDLQNTHFVILKGKDKEVNKILEANYQLEKSFTKDNQGVYLFKKGNIN
jgi:hypothetical protein